MIGTTNDGWKWVAVWLAFACIVERQVPPAEARPNPLRAPVRENDVGPINKVAREIVQLGEAMLGVFK